MMDNGNGERKNSIAECMWAGWYSKGWRKSPTFFISGAAALPAHPGGKDMIIKYRQLG
jgi:hypothetical protein